MNDFPSSVGEYRSALPEIACPDCGKTFVPRSGLFVTSCEECRAKPLGKPAGRLSEPPEAA